MANQFLHALILLHIMLGRRLLASIVRSLLQLRHQVIASLRQVRIDQVILGQCFLRGRVSAKLIVERPQSFQV